MPTSKVRSGNFASNLSRPGARRHRRGDRDNLLVARRLGDQRMGEHIGIAHRPRGGLGLDAGDHVELDHAMIFVGRRFGRAIALALLGHRMDQHRPFVGVADILEDFDQPVDIMSVDRPDVIEAQFLEQGPARRHAAGIFLGLARRAVERAGQLARDPLRELAHGQIFARRDQPREIMRQPADRRRDRHVVVVEDDDQPVARGCGIVHRLIGHARAHRPVADHRDRAARPVGELVRDGETQARPRSTSSCAPRRTGHIRFRSAW